MKTYENSKQIEGLWNTWDIFIGPQAFAWAKMASAPKKPRQTLLSTFFQKDNMNCRLLCQWGHVLENLLTVL